MHTKMFIKNSMILTGMVLSGPALATGYALDTSPTLFGMSMAGAAVFADDLSGMHYNAANMTDMPANQLYGGFALIIPDVSYSNAQGSFLFTNPPTPTGGISSDDDVGPAAFVPSGFLMVSLSDSLRAGLAVTTPWGLSTRYDDKWAGRFYAIDSNLTTVNLNPSLAFAVTPWWSIAGGFQAQYHDARLTKDAVLGVGQNGPIVGFAEVRGNTWDYGWTAGTTVKIGPAVRLGVGYVSKIDANIDGELLINHLSESDASAEITTPEQVNIGASWQVDDQWQILAEANWTRWSRFKELRIQTVVGDDVLDNDWKDSWLYSLGTQYQYNNCWKFRAGVAFDQSPVPSDALRVPQIPDSDRVLASVGATLKLTQNVDVSVGYMHIFFKDASIHRVGTGDDTFHGSLDADYSGHVDLVTTGFNWRFG
jgi:long-chain fatty acid transport protein